MVGPGLDPLAGGGEERHTRGLEFCPPRVFTMAGLEKERRWRGWEEEGKIINVFEMKLKKKREGGLNRWVTVGERFSPFNVHKGVVNG